MSADKQSDWGRVAEDGTVYVKTPDGERTVGQYPEGSPEEALKFYTDRYDALAFEVHLLEQRIVAGKLSPEEAVTTVKALREQVTEANAVGDLTALAARLDATAPVIAIQREAKRVEKAQRSAESKAEKDKIVAEAEKLAESNDWRNGANRLRDLLDQWKTLPRLDKATDDALWRRFSSARTTYTRRRATSTTRCGSASAARRTPSSAPVTRPLPSRTRSSPPTPRSRSGCSSRPRPCCRSPTWSPRSARSATSPSGGTPPARSPATG
jgi:hypothetical protein